MIHLMDFKRSRNPSGFSLLELMIVVAIVSILAAVAYPAYTSQLRKGRRAECRAGLFQAMQQQERYFTQYNVYYASMPAAAAQPSVIKNFSGDAPTKSACAVFQVPAGNALLSGNCTAPGCIALKAQQIVDTADPVSVISLDSQGNKGCTFQGSNYVGNGTAAPKDCWP